MRFEIDDRLVLKRFVLGCLTGLMIIAVGAWLTFA